MKALDWRPPANRHASLAEFGLRQAERLAGEAMGTPLHIKDVDRTTLRRTTTERLPFAEALVRRGARLQGVMKPNTAAPPDQPQAVARPGSTQLSEEDRVIALVYELLDAHSDTTQLASALDFDQFWDAHLDYLRALQRKEREVLAQTSAERPV